MDNIAIGNKYYKSKNNRECIGPCYEPGTWILHPVTLDHVSHPTEPFCPINEWIDIDKRTSKQVIRTIDICHKLHVTPKYKEPNVDFVMPSILFSNEHFLKSYYDISSLEDAVEWCDINQNLSTRTLLRIMDSAWYTYFDKDEMLGNNDIIDDRIVSFYINFTKRNWMDNVINQFAKFVKISDNKISVNYENNDPIPENKIIEVKNFLVEKFISIQSMNNIILRVIEGNNFINFTKKVENELYRTISKKVNKLLK
jgi:hypothetical protein